MIPAEPDCTKLRGWASGLGRVTGVDGTTKPVETLAVAAVLGRIELAKPALGRVIELETEGIAILVDAAAACNRGSVAGIVRVPTAIGAATCKGRFLFVPDFLDFLTLAFNGN